MNAEGEPVEILIVDNDERIVELVAWFLKKRGFAVRSAASFSEARVRIAERRPDLLLSDIDLGEERATEELPALAREGALPPTLIVSGYLDAQIIAGFEALPEVLDTLPKPFDFSELEERVVACLRRVETLIPRASRIPGASRGGADPVAREGRSGRSVAEDEEGWIEILP